MATRTYHRPADNLRAALDQVRDMALKKKRISSERMAELLGVPASTYYKWCEEARMPVDKLALFEHVAECSAATRYLAHRAHLLVIDMPRGRGAVAGDIQGLQGVLHAAVGALIEFGAGTATAEEAIERITAGMESLAFHREDVRKHAEPELEFGA
jgi:hypothetical protein